MNKLQKYFAYRQSLIDQYIKGDMTKSEYLRENFNAVLSLDIKPFNNIDTVDKGLFNYQYYNAMAKDAKMQRHHCCDREKLFLLDEKVDYYYSKKDKATLKVLELLDYRNVEAYYIKTKSKYLHGKLFELTLENNYMILHSTNTLILNRLIEERVFLPEVRVSLIDGYINQRY
ncbi:MAG: hypothetical protein IJ583_15415 [Firmicutes bacterium]|nr:hypothetical protein [Bacillota bacterium]